MKKTFTFLFIMAIGLSSTAQVSFNWSPNDTIVTNLTPNTYTELKIKQSNETADTLRLAIEVVYNDIPAAWDGMVCVHGACLGTIPAVGGTANQTPLYTTTDSGYVRLTVNPFSGTESAKLRIRVYDRDNPADGDTATWIVQGQGLGIHNYESTNTLTMYPNPTNNVVNIESKSTIDKIQLHSINGQVVLSTDVNNSLFKTLNVNGIDNGLYIVNTFSDGKLVGVDKLIINVR